MTTQLPAYAIVSPIKDEADSLEGTIRAVVDQTHQPLRWVIVDDGSTDGSAEIARRWADRHDWIEAVDSGEVAARGRGGPVVRAFKRGLAELESLPLEFVAKMDGDVVVPGHYFAWVAATFAREERAGIVGGLVHVPSARGWVPDRVSRRAVHGCVKSYRLRCLEDIGGLPESMGWDGIDEYAARARGWESFVLTELMVLHYKPRGSKQRWWRARWEEGRGAHFMGYRPEFLCVRAAYRMIFETPPVIGGLLLLAGFAWATLRGAPCVSDAAAVRILRDEQRARLRALARGRSRPQPVPAGGGPAFWHLAADGQESDPVRQRPRPRQLSQDPPPDGYGSSVSGFGHQPDAPPGRPGSVT